MAGPTAPQEFLKAENVGLRMLLEQAGLDARAMLAQAGIDAAERETADKLQKLILEELHHRIKNTLATVGAIGCRRWVAPTICCCRRAGRARASPRSSGARPKPMTARTRRNSR
jgi:hypothetical protein